MQALLPQATTHLLTLVLIFQNCTYMESSIKYSFESGCLHFKVAPLSSPKVGVTQKHLSEHPSFPLKDCQHWFSKKEAKCNSHTALPLALSILLRGKSALLTGKSLCNVSVALCIFTAGADPANRRELPSVLQAARGLQRRVYGGEAKAPPSF